MERSLACLAACMILLSGCVGVLPSDASGGNKETTLADFPDVFATDPVVVVPDEPSPVEQAAADRLAAIVRAETGTTPQLVNSSALTEAHREGALIVLGQPADSGFARVASEANASAHFSTVADREGQVAITENPWNRSQPLALVGGADAFGLWGGTDALYETDNQSVNVTVTYKPITNEELGRIESADNVGGRLRMQVATKRAYVTRGPDAVAGTYLEGARESRFLFQRITVYTTGQFNHSELTTLQTHGVHISQENWISSGDGGSYAAVAPLGELDRLANCSRVTRVETREDVYSTTTTQDPPPNRFLW